MKLTVAAGSATQAAEVRVAFWPVPVTLTVELPASTFKGRWSLAGPRRAITQEIERPAVERDRRGALCGSCCCRLCCPA